MKIIKRKPSKICPCCGKRFFCTKGYRGKKWENRIWCSRSCAGIKIPHHEYLTQKFNLIINNSIIMKSGCREWKGTLNSGGYGIIKIYGKFKSVHRMVYQILKEDIPEGFYVLHKCDNTKCINPDHLFLGTQQDNVNDMINKERNCYKINKEQKQEIIQMAIEGIPYYKIAEKFNVSATITCRIARQNGIHRG